MNDYNNCNEVHCLTPKPFCHDGKCYKKCPEDLVANNSVCISFYECMAADWVVYHNTCFRSCPLYTRKVAYIGSEDWCKSILSEGITVTIAAVGIVMLIFACHRLLSNPEKPRKKMRQHYKEEIQPYQDDDQTAVLSTVPCSTQSYVRRQPIHNADTSMKEVDGWIQSLSPANSSINGIADLEGTSSNYVPQRSYEHDQLATNGSFEQFVREDEELSSIPTIVAMKGFQRSENSMDFSLCDQDCD